MTVTPSTILSAGTNPTTTEQLWGLSVLLQADWKPPLSVKTIWQTAIKHAESVQEQRWARTLRPSREVAVPIMAVDPNTLNSILTRMWRSAEARWLAPLWVDAFDFSGAITLGQTVISFDTTKRRYFAGGRVAIFQYNSDTSVSLFEVAEIDSVADGSITLTAGTVNAYAANRTSVVPLIEAELVPSTEVSLATHNVAQAVWTAKETVGPSALDASITGLQVPTGVPVYKCNPVFDFPIEWSSGKAPTLGMRREGTEFKIGLGTSFAEQGTRYRGTLQCDVTCYNRTEAWKLMQFFDFVKGRKVPFLVPAQTNDIELEAINSVSEIEVTARGEGYDWNLRPYISMQLKDGSYLFAKVDSVVRAGDTDTVTFETDLASLPTLADVERCGTAYVMRFDTDVLEEKWLTSEVMVAPLRLVEVYSQVDLTSDCIVEPNVYPVGTPGTEVSPLTTPLVDPPYGEFNCADLQGIDYEFTQALVGCDASPAYVQAQYDSGAETESEGEFFPFTRQFSVVCDPIGSVNTQTNTRTITGGACPAYGSAGTSGGNIILDWQEPEARWRMRLTSGVDGSTVYVAYRYNPNPVGVYHGEGRLPSDTGDYQFGIEVSVAAP